MKASLKKASLKSVIALCVVLTLAAASLCGCARHYFELRFQLDKSVVGAYRIAYINSDPKHNLAFDAICPLDEGAFHGKYPLSKPAVVYISPIAQGRTVPFFVKPGDKITITGNSTEPMEWTVTGNKVNEKLTAWRLENAAVLEHGSAESVNNLVAAYVRKNPDEQAALIILCTFFDRYADDALFRKLWTSLDSKLREPETLAIFGRADLAETVTGKLPPLPKSFKARYLDDSLVTVNLKDARKTLFWVRSSNADHSSSVDSIRKIFRNADAKRLRLVTVSFDNDSSSMIRAFRYDSIPAEVPLWAPDAETGALAAQLSVDRTPYFLLADSLGRVLYRGDNATELLPLLKKK